MFNSVKFKHLKAQHIVELALFAPFVIIFIGIVTDIAYAMHSNYKFTASLNEAAGVIAPLHKINTDENETNTSIQNYTRMLAKSRYTPYFETIETNLVNTGDITFLTGTYEYTSAFNILNSIYQFTPGVYEFVSIIPLNSAVTRKNAYNIPGDELQSIMNAFYTPAADEGTE